MFFSEWGLSFDRIIWQIISFLWKSRDFRFFCLNFTELIFYLISSPYLRSSLVKSFDILYLQTLFECFNRNFSSIASTKQHKKIFRVYLFCQDFRVFSLRCLVVKSKPESFSFLFSYLNKRWTFLRLHGDEKCSWNFLVKRRCGDLFERNFYTCGPERRKYFPRGLFSPFKFKFFRCY